MGWLMSKIYDRFMEGVEEAGLRDWRRSLLSRASGEVLEVGAGTGVNLGHYPDDVSSLTVLEPDPHMRAELGRRLGAEQRRRVRLVASSGEELPFESGRFQTVVATLVLCSVDDLQRVLSEIRRVLEAGGCFIFLEHVAAGQGTGRRRWQRRLEPIWKRLTGNCHLTRETGAAIEEAGFEIEEMTRESMRKAWPIVRPTVRGVATKPAVV